MRIYNDQRVYKNWRFLGPNNVYHILRPLHRGENNERSLSENYNKFLINNKRASIKNGYQILSGSHVPKRPIAQGLQCKIKPTFITGSGYSMYHGLFVTRDVFDSIKDEMFEFPRPYNDTHKKRTTGGKFDAAGILLQASASRTVKAFFYYYFYF